jgi:hypothetical protein
MPSSIRHPTLDQIVWLALELRELCLKHFDGFLAKVPGFGIVGQVTGKEDLRSKPAIEAFALMVRDLVVDVVSLAADNNVGTPGTRVRVNGVDLEKMKKHFEEIMTRSRGEGGESGEGGEGDMGEDWHEGT